MSNNCYCQTSCAGLSIVASIIIGIIAGMLRFIGVITITPAFLWVLFGISVAYLAISYITASISCSCNINRCICHTLPVFYVGVLGTIPTSLILLLRAFSATSIIASVITGFLTGFFTLLITSTICMIKCRTACTND